MAIELTNIPDNWVWTSIDQLYEVVGGGTPPTKNEKYWKGNIPWITSADIHSLRDIRPRKSITREAIENSATNLVPENTLIVVTRVSLGKVALTSTPLCFSQDSQALIGNNSLIYPLYSLHYLSQAVQTFKYRHRGTTISGVPKKQLKELPFPLPPYAEQVRIVSKIEELFSRIDSAENSMKRILSPDLKEFNLIRQLKKSILKKAFEGRLVPQDFDDEPASVLLERIKAEKALLKPSLRGGRRRRSKS